MGHAHRSMDAETILYPDYADCIVNLTSSILRWAGVPAEHSPLAQVDAGALARSRTVVLMIFDGMGYELLRRWRESSAAFLWSSMQGTITSVFPPTTSAAIPSIMTGKTPAQHGVLGWSLFFKEYGKYIDYLPFRDHLEGTQYSRSAYKVSSLLGADNIFQAMQWRGVETVYLLPRRLNGGEYSRESSAPARRIPYGSVSQLFRRLRREIRRPPAPRGGRSAAGSGADRKFIYSYCADPDHHIHLQGNGSAEVGAFLARVDRALRETAERLAGTPATLFVTADHGLVDTDRVIAVNEDRALFDSLVLPPFPEKRFLSMFVKSHRRAQFEEAAARYANEFLVMKREEFLRSGLLGPGEMKPKLDDFLGDYLLLGTGRSQMATRVLQPVKDKKDFVAHHAGLRREEMLVPLVRIELS